MSFLLFVVLFIHLVTYDASCQVLEFWSLPSLHYNGTRRQSAPGARKKIHLKKSTACLFPEIMTQMWRTLTLKSRPEHRAGRNELCGLLLGSRTVISGKSHCLLSFFLFFLFDFRVSCPFRSNLRLRFSATVTRLLSVTMSLANASKNWDLTCPLVGTSAPEIWRFIL